MNIFQHLTDSKDFLNHELIHNLLDDSHQQDMFVNEVVMLIASEKPKEIHLPKIDTLATSLQEKFLIKKEKKIVIKAILCAAKLREIILSSSKYHGQILSTSLEYFQQAIECAKEHMELHPSKSKNLVLMIGSLLEGTGKQYTTGGSEAQATKDRVELFHLLYNYSPKERPNKKKRSKFLDSEEASDESSCSDQSDLSRSILDAAAAQLKQEAESLPQQPLLKKVKYDLKPLFEIIPISQYIIPAPAAIPVVEDTYTLTEIFVDGDDNSTEAYLPNEFDCDMFDFQQDFSIKELQKVLSLPLIRI